MANYVVAGVTGRVGSTVASELLTQGERVTVIVRDEARGLDWAQRGAEVARGSLDDRSFLSHAVRDTAGFFALLPENVAPDDFHGARRRMADAIADAVQLLETRLARSEHQSGRWAPQYHWWLSGSR